MAPRRQIKKFWCAVSTHEEEDIFCLKTHLNIKKIHKDIITIIIPRHIDRAQSIKSSCKKLSLKSQIYKNFMKKKGFDSIEMFRYLRDLRNSY